MWSRRSRSSCEAKVIERLGPPLAEPIFEELAIIGVGLIGSSIARAARARISGAAYASSACQRV